MPLVADETERAHTRAKHYKPERWNSNPRLRRISARTPCEVAMRDEKLTAIVEHWFMESDAPHELRLSVGDGRFAVFRREKSVVGGIECVVVRDVIKGTVFRGRPARA